jgi:modulator of FtsH protease HflK
MPARWPLWLLMIAGLVYLATGFVVLRADEAGVVRWFGRQQSALLEGGWHYVGPWPIAQVDRVVLTETLQVSWPPAASAGHVIPGAAGSDPTGLWMCGDKNLIELKLTVHARLRRDGAGQYLFQQAAPQGLLRLLLASVVTESLAQSGVDYVQTGGLTELPLQMQQQLQRRSDRCGLGLQIERVLIDESAPPVRVLADFLDVSNARAEAARAIAEATTAAEQQVAHAQSQTRVLIDQAHQRATDVREQGVSRADRLSRWLADIESQAASNPAARQPIRAAMMRRLWWQAMSRILRSTQRLLVTPADRPIDLWIAPPKTQP